jgi:hypothetical protein
MLIDWCLTPTLTIFQPYRGVKKKYKINPFYLLILYRIVRIII